MSDMRQFVATPTVEELEAEIEQLRAGCDRLHGYIAEKDAEIERLTAENKEHIAAYQRCSKEREKLEWALERMENMARYLLFPARIAGEGEEAVHHLKKAIDATHVSRCPNCGDGDE